MHLFNLLLLITPLCFAHVTLDLRLVKKRYQRSLSMPPVSPPRFLHLPMYIVIGSKRIKIGLKRNQVNTIKRGEQTEQLTRPTIKHNETHAPLDRLPTKPPIQSKTITPSKIPPSQQQPSSSSLLAQPSSIPTITTTNLKATQPTITTTFNQVSSSKDDPIMFVQHAPVQQQQHSSPLLQQQQSQPPKPSFQLQTQTGLLTATQQNEFIFPQEQQVLNSNPDNKKGILQPKDNNSLNFQSHPVVIEE